MNTAFVKFTRTGGAENDAVEQQNAGFIDPFRIAEQSASEFGFNKKVLPTNSGCS